MSSLPQKQTRWLPTVHRGMWRMCVLESSCLPLLAWAFLALCCSYVIWYKNKTVLLWERILRHQFTGALLILLVILQAMCYIMCYICDQALFSVSSKNLVPQNGWLFPPVCVSNSGIPADWKEKCWWINHVFLATWFSFGVHLWKVQALLLIVCWSISTDCIGVVGEASLKL